MGSSYNVEIKIPCRSMPGPSSQYFNVELGKHEWFHHVRVTVDPDEYSNGDRCLTVTSVYLVRWIYEGTKGDCGTRTRDVTHRLSRATLHALGVAVTDKLIESKRRYGW